MAYRYVWWPATTTRKHKITREYVTIDDDQKVAFVYKTGRATAYAVPLTRIFKTKDEAQDAVTLQGKLGWAFQLSTWGRQKPVGGKIQRVRASEGYNGNYHCKPVDSKGRPTKADSFYGRFFETEAAAYKDLAERLRVEVDTAERDLREVRQKTDFLRKIVKAIEKAGYKVPTTKQLEKRRADRRRRRMSRSQG
jgi:hypothetical protein